MPCHRQTEHGVGGRCRADPRSERTGNRWIPQTVHWRLHVSSLPGSFWSSPASMCHCGDCDGALPATCLSKQATLSSAHRGTSQARFVLNRLSATCIARFTFLIGCSLEASRKERLAFDTNWSTTAGCHSCSPMVSAWPPSFDRPDVLGGITSAGSSRSLINRPPVHRGQVSHPKARFRCRRAIRVGTTETSTPSLSGLRSSGRLSSVVLLRLSKNPRPPSEDCGSDMRRRDPRPSRVCSMAAEGTKEHPVPSITHLRTSSLRKTDTSSVNCRSHRRLSHGYLAEIRPKTRSRRNLGIYSGRADIVA